jgi:hypothetical protein
MTLLAYLTDAGPSTVKFLLGDITSGHTCKMPHYAGLPATQKALEDELRALKSEGKVIETWPQGAKEGVWRVASGSKVKAQQPELFA